MNKHDKDNLLFIMSLDIRQFNKWYDSLTPDDAEYAHELILAARTELAVQVAEIFDQAAEEDLTEANKVLKKFMLN
jgi:hypothetical protein